MKPMIFTLVGQDKPGLISDLANTVYEMNGNWLGSNLSHMAGHFAGFVHIDLPEDKHQNLIDIFSQHPHLKIHLLAGEKLEDNADQTAKIEITGNDRSGIVQELTQILNQFNLNIMKFDSSCQSAPNWGGSLFKATAIISIANDFDLDDLRESLESVANDLMVDIEFQ
jgi:glycine cleavage system regulatory protein